MRDAKVYVFHNPIGGSIPPENLPDVIRKALQHWVLAIKFREDHWVKLDGN